MGIKSAIKRILPKEKELYPMPKPVNVQQILEGKIALITGGSGGIGFAIAKAFLESGCKVIICGTNEDKLKDCIDKLHNTNVRSLVLNVLDTGAIPSKIAEASELFEERHIDILVNSAGVGTHSSFLNMDEKEYDMIMDVNVKGTFFVSQAVAKFMIENNVQGHILNLSSSSALRPAWTAYEMSKWSIRGFTLGLADKLLPYGIIVNAIAPGPVATPMLGKSEEGNIYRAQSPSKRYSVPSEIAALATFMVSDLGDLIVGDTYYITGGSGTISLHK